MTELKPEIDGISYDDMWKVSDHATRALLCARDLVWMTHLEHDGIEFAGTVIAKDRTEAEKIADARGLGETVQGLYKEVVAPHGPMSESAKNLLAEIRDTGIGLKVPEHLWPAAIELAQRDHIILGRAVNGFRTAKLWHRD
jgi:hypothetical protein